VDDILSEIERLRKFSTQPGQIKIEFELESDEKAIFEKLSNDPVNIDVLAEALHKSPFELLPVLLDMEIKGYVRQLAGKMFVRV